LATAGEGAGAGAEESLAALPLEAGDDAAIGPWLVRRRDPGWRWKAASPARSRRRPWVEKKKRGGERRVGTDWGSNWVRCGPRLGLEPIGNFDGVA
jgi:hypothetical protein